MRDIARRLALRLGVVGLMNVQFALHGRARSTSSRSTRAPRARCPSSPRRWGCRWSAIAVPGDGGEDPRRAGLHRGAAGAGRLRQGAGLPVPPLPRRRSGAGPGDEVDRRGDGLGAAPSATPSPRPGWGRGTGCRSTGTAFLSVHDRDKAALLPVARRLAELGFELVATAGTAAYLEAEGLAVRTDAQGPRGAPARGRPPDQRRDRPGRQHPAGPRLPRGRRARSAAPP